MLQIQTNPETLIVTRDGYLDEEYYDEIYSLKRREALHTAGREVLHAAVQTPFFLGKGILYLLSSIPEHAN